MNTSRKVIGIGEIVLDILFREGQPLRATPGGSVFNTLVSLCRCGVPARFVGELGMDGAGRIVRAFMEANGMATDGIDFFDDGQSPVGLAFLDGEGEARFSFYRDFPRRRLNVAFPEVGAGDILLFGSYFAVCPALRGRLREWLQYARSRGAVLVYDINFREAHAAERKALLPDFVENFHLAGFTRCSDEDLAVLFPGQTVEGIYDRYFLPAGKTLVITQGVGDTLLLTPSGRKSYPVERVTPVSTVGAGDSFNAGLVYGMMKHDVVALTPAGAPTEGQWDEWIGYAQRTAAKVCLSLENYVTENGIV